MKFISLILAATASVMIAATPLTSPNVATNVFARDDCKICDDFYQKCRGSIWCWLNPVGCDISCRADACRKYAECHNKCGYSC